MSATIIQFPFNPDLDIKRLWDKPCAKCHKPFWMHRANRIANCPVVCKDGTLQTANGTTQFLVTQYFTPEA
jgi:hypothetical protein